jgi:hypothetical protein
MLIYALSYVFPDGEKSASIISEKKDILMDIHKTSTLDPTILFHQYKQKIIRIDINVIQCYTYNNIEKTLKPYDITDNKPGWDFYASYEYPVINTNSENLNEMIIYMSKDEHDIWLNDETIITISFGKVEFDTYYVEGILNA